MTRPLILFGSTGSIGCSTLDAVRRHRDRFRVCALAAGDSLERLSAQITEFAPQSVCVRSPETARQLRERFCGLTVLHGADGLSELVERHAGACLVAASNGTVALPATVEALRRGMRVCLANKETLVAAGELINRELDDGGAELLPVDSELSAIFQCLAGSDRRHLRQVILTASGGPFRDHDAARLATITIAEALAHPNWAMGRKISIDSATLMNKALEMIETRHLFRLRPEQIGVLIHPQSIVHSLVEFADHSLIAQLSVPDMRIPILYALGYPDRLPGPAPALDLAATARLEFQAVDERRHRALALARQAMASGGNSGAVLNAANEVAVEAFLKGRIPFTAIVELVSRVLDAEPLRPMQTLDDVLETTRAAERRAASLIEREVPR